jgi:hypothetical protein
LAELSLEAHAGFNAVAEPAIYNVGAVAFPRGHPKLSTLSGECGFAITASRNPE